MDDNQWSKRQQRREIIVLQRSLLEIEGKKGQKEIQLINWCCCSHGWPSWEVGTQGCLHFGSQTHPIYYMIVKTQWLYYLKPQYYGRRKGWWVLLYLKRTMGGGGGGSKSFTRRKLFLPTLCLPKPQHSAIPNHIACLNCCQAGDINGLWGNGSALLLLNGLGQSASSPASQDDFLQALLELRQNIRSCVSVKGSNHPFVTLLVHSAWGTEKNMGGSDGTEKETWRKISQLLSG